MTPHDQTRAADDPYDATVETGGSDSAVPGGGTLSPGDRVGVFEVVRFLAQGGMGEVYEARQLQPNRQVALKILSPRLVHEPSRIDRFLKEARMSGRAEHPYIVGFYDAGESDGIYYLAMAFVDGQSAAERVMAGGPLDEGDALRTADHVARALDDRFRLQQLLHRDVKPSNILFDHRGGIKLTDFGLSTILDEASELTRPDFLLGSPDYMSPEQIRNPTLVDWRSDLYALGCTLYFLLTGSAPFARSQTAEVLHDQMYTALPDPRKARATLSEGTWRLLQGMTAKDAAGRYPSWASFLEDVHDVRRGRLPTRWSPPRARGLWARVQGLFER